MNRSSALVSNKCLLMYRPLYISAYYIVVSKFGRDLPTYDRPRPTRMLHLPRDPRRTSSGVTSDQGRPFFAVLSCGVWTRSHNNVNTLSIDDTGVVVGTNRRIRCWASPLPYIQTVACQVASSSAVDQVVLRFSIENQHVSLGKCLAPSFPHCESFTAVMSHAIGFPESRSMHSEEPYEVVVMSGLSSQRINMVSHFPRRTSSLKWGQ